MFQPRWYQQEAEQSIFDYFANHNGNPVIALPTGTGKSIVIANTIKRIFQGWPGQRVIKMTHVKELIEQNSNKLLEAWPQAPLGIYSAGLNRKETHAPIIFGGVGSIVRNLGAFGHRDLGFIDEAHLVSPDAETMYGRVINHFRAINPYFKVIGLSATPWRLGQGYITDGGIFTDICYNLTGVEAFTRLIAEGYLAPLIPKKTNVEIDASGIGISNGDYKQHDLQELVDNEKTTFAALQETMLYAPSRRSAMVFATGIQHAEHINEMLIKVFGQTSVCLHSKKSDEVNEKALADWKAGRVKWAVNMGKLTTGIDHPPLDLIVMLRPTISPVLWVQMLGRGTRPSPATGKQFCMVLDFAGNTKKLGPINDPVIPKKKGKGTGDAPVKICEECGCYNHASVRFCAACNFEFIFEDKFKDTASTEELISTGIPLVEYFNVNKVTYLKHEKIGKPPSVRVTYYCDMQMFKEWVAFDNPKARKLALDWLRQRIPLAKEYEDGATTDNVLSIAAQLRVPKRIRVWVNKLPYPEVLGYEY
jgi:DNA repair protein RadD